MIILGTNSVKAAGGFNVANSLRFNSASNDHLNRTQTAGNRRKFTFSTWVKRCNPATRMALFLANRSSSNYDQFYLNEGGYIEADFYHSGTQIFRYKTNALYRDPSAWYHIILAVDTEHSSASSRVRIYVNGLEVTSFSTETNPSQDVDTHVNENSIVAYIGSDYNSNEPDYYLAETVMLDGTQATPTDFGEFDSDSGIWKPIDVSGLTFGTNGFYLDYEDSSALGNDAAGSNNFTVNNLTAIDQSTDTCTNNMPVINQLTLHSNGVTVSEGNLVATTGDAPWQSTNCTFGLTTGKWYWEFKATESSTNQYLVLGIQSDNLLSSAANGFGYSNNYSYGFKNYNGEFVYNESDGGGSGSYGNAVTDGQIIGVALDLVNLKIYFSINGTYQNSGNPTSGSTGTGSPVTLQSGQTYFPSLVIARAGGTGTIPIGEYNFGSPPYSESGGNSDADGYGNFKTAPPSGYFSINSKNLAEYG